MQNAQGKIVCQAITFSDKEGFKEITTEIPLQEGIPGLGMPVTKEAADQMIDKYITANIDNPHQNLSIEFGRETLLYLLAQCECESLKLYFCINHKGEKSLVAVPMKMDRRTILIKNADGEEIAGSEVGGGETILQFLERNKGFKPGGFDLLR